MMKARPILMNTEMAKATWEGRKTQTRRVIKQIPPHWKSYGINKFGEYIFYPDDEFELEHTEPLVKCPFGKVGDLLYVRETFFPYATPSLKVVGDNMPIIKEDYKNAWDETLYKFAYYKADDMHGCNTKWKPSIHMPRWASRMTLEITDIRVERLQDISSADAIKEGIFPTTNSLTIDCDTPDPRDGFKSLWQSINGAESWEQNPFCWVISFKLHKVNVDEFIRMKGDE